MNRMNQITVVVALASLTWSGCSGRDPRVADKNTDAINNPSEGEGEGEGEGDAPTRTLSTRKLFGTLPIQDRFLDPLFTMATGVGWQPFSGDFNSYATFHARAIPTPTDTPALELGDIASNPSGVAMLGEYKGARAREAVSIWLGRSTSEAGVGFADVAVAVIGTFVAGDGSVDLTAEPDSVVRGDVTWTRFSVILEEGPVGWANLYVEDAGNAALFVAGPNAEDVGPPGPTTLIRVATPRTSTPRERQAVQVANDRSHQQLARPHGPSGPPLLPGTPPR